MAAGSRLPICVGSVARTIIVGDVHGCSSEFRELVERVCGFSKERGDVVISVGDLVAKGKDGGSVEAVRVARDVYKAEAVRGNHEDFLLRCADAPDSDEAKGTEHLKIAQSLSKEEVEWVRNWPLYLRHSGVLVVHSGVRPGVRPEDMSKSELVSMRFIDSAGNVCETSTGDDCKLWAPGHDGPEFVVFGHDAQRGLQLYPWAIGLDTGCCYGGSLTALIFPDNLLISLPAKKTYTIPNGPAGQTPAQTAEAIKSLNKSPQKGPLRDVKVLDTIPAPDGPTTDGKPRPISVCKLELML